MAVRKGWEPWEDTYMRDNYPVLAVSVKSIASYLKRSMQSIYARAIVLGLQRDIHPHSLHYKDLSEDEFNDLEWRIHIYRKNEDLSSTEIGERIGLTKTQVQHQMYSKKLHLQEPEGPKPAWVED